MIYDTIYHKIDYFWLNYYILLFVISIFTEILSENDRKYLKTMIICKIYDIPPFEIRGSECPEQVLIEEFKPRFAPNSRGLYLGVMV